MNHFISLAEAVQMTALYRSNREAILQPAHQNQNLLPLSETFDRQAFDSVLAKSGCTALRLYYGMSEDLKIHAIVVGVDAAGNDMLPASGGSLLDTGEDIIENSLRCPDICPNASPLNT